MQLINPPSPEHLSLLKYLLILMFLLHLPFISMVIGGSFFSVIFNILGRRKSNNIYSDFAQDLVDTTARNKSVGLILGVLPLLTLTFILPQVFYDSDIPIANFWIYITVLASIGLALLYTYQYTFSLREERFRIHIGTGILSVLLLFVAYFIFARSISLVTASEQFFWGGESGFAEGKGRQWSWNVISKYLHFITLSFAITGSGILFFYYNWPEGKNNLDEDYSGFVKKFGIGIALIFTLFQPVLLLWNLFTLKVVISETIFGGAVIALVLLMIICYMLYVMFKRSAMRLGVYILALFLLTFLVTIVNDQIIAEKPTSEQIMLTVPRVEEDTSEAKSESEKTETKAAIDDKKGEAVCTLRCMSCHTFDKKFVGPPFREVVPKYQHKLDELKEFIRNPTRKNLAYSAMPKIRMKEHEIEAVAVYLLKQIEEIQPQE